MQSKVIVTSIKMPKPKCLSSKLHFSKTKLGVHSTLYFSRNRANYQCESLGIIFKEQAEPLNEPTFKALVSSLLHYEQLTSCTLDQITARRLYDGLEHKSKLSAHSGRGCQSRNGLSSDNEIWATNGLRMSISYIHSGIGSVCANLVTVLRKYLA